MSRGIRSLALAVGTAAFLSAQVAYAAPAAPAAPTSVLQQTTDPLVSLSLLGSPQSRAVVSTGMPSVMAGSAATTAALQPNPPPRGPNLLLLGLGGLLLAVVIVAIATSGNGNSNGNLTPVSPD